MVTTSLVNGQASSTVAGARPWACAVSPDSTRVWMANIDPNEIDVLNIGTGKLAGIIEAPANAGQMVLTPDGSTLFAEIGPGPGTVAQLAVLNTGTGKAVPQNLNLSPMAMAMSPDGSKLVVASYALGVTNLAIVDVPTLTVTATFPTSIFANGIVFSPDGTRYYVGGSANGMTAIASFNSATNALIAMQNVAGYSGELTISPDGSTLYAVYDVNQQKADHIMSIDAISLATTGMSGLVHVSRGLVVSKDGSVVYSISSTGSGGTLTLDVSNASTLALVTSTTISPNGNVGSGPLMALSPDGTALYISDYRQTVVVNTANLSSKVTFPVAAASAYLFGPR